MEDDDELARYLEEDVKVGNCIVANAKTLKQKSLPADEHDQSSK